MLESLKKQDPEVFSSILAETKRQQHGIEMIASENIVSKAVLEAMGTVLTNKYSEGYPGKRYYGGNECIDKSETLAIERAKKLFNAEHVNVQPHAGSQANMASYMAVLNLKDKILSMDLAHGGHLTHGSPVNFSGGWYDVHFYGVDKETETIDMDEVRRIAEKEHPKLILSGASAYPREIDFNEFHEIAKDVGAYSMADIAHIAGLVAAKIHPDPVKSTDIVTTTTHKTLRGPRGAMIMCKIKDRVRPDDKKNLAQKIDSAVFPGMQGGPLDHIIAAKAVAFNEALQPDFAGYQKQVVKNAGVLAETLMDKGMNLVSGGTDNHLIMINLKKSCDIMGKEAVHVLDSVGIYTNKNMIPFDTGSPFNPSGLRLGTPALTSRGMKTEDMKQIGEWISTVLTNPNDEQLKLKIKKDVKELVAEFPIYEDLAY